MLEAQPELLRRLRSQAERALQGDRARAYAEQLLDQMLSLAPPRSEHSVFAHRRLAELRLERHPWRAALHLRRVLEVSADDDAANALMGLAHALLGNYRAAASAYRNAIALTPRNPWYHHNLGHLLDVGLGQGRRALTHLRLAHALQPDEHEITASLARCLGNIGELEEARRLADEACTCAPHNTEHRKLRSWIDRKASPQRRDVETRGPCAAPRLEATSRAVLGALRQNMTGAGFSSRQVQCACALWVDFRGRREVRVSKPEVLAAAVEYALARVMRMQGVTQASLARRYGVAATSISSRYSEIREVLALRPGDPRYASMQ
ncbi:MAG: tetratricopeptide repeat protein [Proteobacteria bacterium]|nr:tetratricopeptide repeat protein [Pseudomonadota bacterium]